MIVAKKRVQQKKLFSPSSSKTLQIIKNTLWNARNGQIAQKLKIDPKRWKKLKTTENCLGMIFVTKYQKLSFWRKPVFMTKFFSKRFKSIKLAAWKQIRPNNTKIKNRSKLLKHTENILERVFVTKQQNNFLSIKNFLFKPILSKNVSSQLKLAYKHQIQPNSTKTKTRSKTSKTDKNHWKPLMSGFHDLIATENLFNKKTLFHKNC